MPRLRRFALTSALLLAASAAHADDAPPRDGTLMSLQAESPAIWLADDRVFGPAGTEFLSACAAGRGCAPVVSHQACEPPACPGHGWVLRVTEQVADVPDWPTDVEGYQRALSALTDAPRLASLGLQEHPDAARWRRETRDERRRHEQSVRWVSRHRDGDRLELSLGGAVATLGETPGTWVGATLAADYVFLHRARDSDERDLGVTVADVLVGDQIGASLRVHFLYRLDDTQEAEWITAVGISDAIQNRYETSAVRLPTFSGTLAPELGVILRADRDPTWYIAWDAPFSFLIHHDVAIDVAPRVMLIDDWIGPPEDAPEDASDPVEVIVMVGAGLRLP
ncbi:MAG TPA: hypothetical protein RMH99_30180 [Sandaracinaceae bacterium LLY-WYZ-13_1]|nr:hypothetical protein [Sandaracinaceae bacterium LLY-WYZ-13_1]